MGVSDPTLTSPKVWPTKKELKGEAWLGEDPPPPVAHDNYPTAELFVREIEATFYEERALDMVDGPFTRSEAAERCRCKPEELCPGPLAGIDESDKIRTIYDGSKGGANAHIQAHTGTALTRRRRPKSSKAAIARCGSPVVKAHGSPSGVILCWNHFTRDLSGLGTSEHQPPTHAWSACLPAPASEAPVHGSVGANGDASGNLRARTSFGGLPEVVQAFFQLQNGWRKGFVNGHTPK